MRPAAIASPRHNRARFGETDEKSYLCISRKRKSAVFSSFCVFGANYPIWAEKLSYRIVKIISKLVKICSFIISPKCFIVKFFIKIIRILSEQISIVLIIPKSLRRAALTIANAPFTPCAERRAALTSFAFLAGACLRIPIRVCVWQVYTTHFYRQLIISAQIVRKDA